VRIFAARRTAVLIVCAAAVLPRLVVLLHERGAILSSFVEKSDIFAREFIASGTYGFVPGVPSAYTQPLYGWFLIVIYRVADRSWAAIGLAQIGVACATSLVVLEIGRRYLSPRAGLLGALIATLNPYLIWHDVHVNREILDQLAAAAMFLLALAAARSHSLLPTAALGGFCGAAILGNGRLTALPVALGLFVVWGLPLRRAALLGTVLLGCTVVVLAPWLIRNKEQVGCLTLTTDAHALWKANNVNTYSTLAHGGWIDDVPPLPGHSPITPEYEYAFWHNDHRIVRVNECAQMRLYRHETIEFWRHHPGEKLKLMVQATRMLWQPEQTLTEGGPPTSFARRWAEAVWTVPIYILALIGLALAPRRFAALAAIFVGYETLAAWVFAGSTRYRVAFDFVLALLAAAALDRLASSRRYTAATPSTAASTPN